MREFGFLVMLWKARHGDDLVECGIAAAVFYLLRFERVDNLRAYRIPSETGLLIASDYNNYYRYARFSDDEGLFPARDSHAIFRIPSWLA